MMSPVLPKAVRELSYELMKLPGIGPKSARRLAIYLLRQPRSVVARLGDSLKSLHANVRVCRICFNLAEEETCQICRDETRVAKQLCVVEDPLDVEAIEKTNSYRGRYHVLGGVLSPLEGINEEQLTLVELRNRINQGEIKEVIIALNPTVEGEATGRHIMNFIDKLSVVVTRLGRGLPTGGDIEYADEVTLTAAFEGRKKL